MKKEVGHEVPHIAMEILTNNSLLKRKFQFNQFYLLSQQSFGRLCIQKYQGQHKPEFWGFLKKDIELIW